MRTLNWRYLRPYISHLCYVVFKQAVIRLFFFLLLRFDPLGNCLWLQWLIMRFWIKNSIEVRFGSAPFITSCGVISPIKASIIDCQLTLTDKSDGRPSSGNGSTADSCSFSAASRARRAAGAVASHINVNGFAVELIDCLLRLTQVQKAAPPHVGIRCRRPWQSVAIWHTIDLTTRDECGLRGIFSQWGAASVRSPRRRWARCTYRML